MLQLHAACRKSRKVEIPVLASYFLERIISCLKRFQMVGVLDDVHLATLQCSKCHKYLSVFPVRNHSSRDVTCGRCSRDDDDDEGERSTLYELIAEKYLFKCVNRYEGCRELLRTEETEAHERECVGNVFHCPKCEDGIERSVLALIWHYRIEHPSSYSKKNSIKLKSSKRDVMLYIQDDVVFFIYKHYVSDSNKLYLKAVTLTNDVKATQTFYIGVGSRGFERTEMRLCKTIMNTIDNDDFFMIDWDAAEPLDVVFDLEVSERGRPRPRIVHPVPDASSTANVSRKKFKVKLTEELKKSGYELNDTGTALLHQDGHKIDLTCANCEELIGIPLYRCCTLHQICKSCSTWCGICNREPVQSHSDTEIISCLEFPCKWNCGRYFISGLRNHENSCKLKMIKCPKCPAEFGLMFMRRHLNNFHKSRIIDFFKEYDADKIKRNCVRWYGDIYIVLNDKCCRLQSFKDCTVMFDSLVDGPNTKLELIVYKGSESTKVINCTEKINKQDLHLYTPYINFKTPPN